MKLLMFIFALIGWVIGFISNDIYTKLTAQIWLVGSLLYKD